MIVYSIRRQPPEMLFAVSVLTAVWLVFLVNLVKDSAAPPTPLPEVVLLYSPGRLTLDNLGSQTLDIWGTKIEDSPAIIEAVSRKVPRGHHYYFLTEKLERSLLSRLAPSGDALLPFHVYVSDENGMYIARFLLRVIVSGENVSIHTQQVGVERRDWRSMESNHVPRQIPQP